MRRQPHQIGEVSRQREPVKDAGQGQEVSEANGKKERKSCYIYSRSPL